MSNTNYTAMSFSDLERLHREAYPLRYPGLKTDTSGRKYQPTGSSYVQWGLTLNDTPAARELYALGYKPGEARKLLAKLGRQWRKRS